MEIKAAVKKAFEVTSTLFENIEHLGLEEVEFDEHADRWLITVGFSRPWDYPKSRLAAIDVFQPMSSQPKREYKKVEISNQTGEMISIKNREVQSQA